MNERGLKGKYGKRGKKSERKGQMRKWSDKWKKQGLWTITIHGNQILKTVTKIKQNLTAI